MITQSSASECHGGDDGDDDGDAQNRACGDLAFQPLERVLYGYFLQTLR